MTPVPQKFRKKPVVIEAVQVPRYEDYDGRTMAFVNAGIAIADWCNGTARLMLAEEDGEHPRIDIPTREGVMAASEGDWIIKGVKGEFYPCKPDIFEVTYEPIYADGRPREWPEDRHYGFSDPLG